jgi:hypothetical protein
MTMYAIGVHTYIEHLHVSLNYYLYEKRLARLPEV